MSNREDYKMELPLVGTIILFVATLFFAFVSISAMLGGLVR